MLVHSARYRTFIATETVADTEEPGAVRRDTGATATRLTMQHQQDHANDGMNIH